MKRLLENHGVSKIAHFYCEEVLELYLLAYYALKSGSCIPNANCPCALEESSKSPAQEDASCWDLSAG